VNFTVYVLYSADNHCLYVGQSAHLIERLRTHNSASAWYGQVATIKIEHATSRGFAMCREAELIRSLKPIHNVVGVERDVLKARRKPSHRRSVSQPETLKAKIRRVQGTRIKAHREAANIRQGELADSLGVSKQSIHQWETGRTTPRREYQIALAAALSFDWLDVFNLDDIEAAA
jgi:DNA-binding XRE family transcriptional regulator/predicted GIY-YIG superfamily endonuclease